MPDDDPAGGNMTFRQFAVIAALVLLTGCGSAHNPMTFKSYEVSPAEDGGTVEALPAHQGKIWVTTASLPEGVKYKTLQKVDVGSNWYGSSDKLNPLFAKLARKAGADAVIQVSTWHQPKAFSWSAPQGQGIAVKIIEPEGFDLATVTPGGWY